MNSAIAKFGVIYPVHLLRGELTPFHRNEIRSCDFLAADKLTQFHQAKLGHLLRHCYSREPYYRRMLESFAARFPMDRPLEFFQEVPFLQKELIRSKARPSRWRRLDCRSTSGSTGLPMTFYKDRLATGYMEAVQNHAYAWHGIDVGDPQGRFWGMPFGRGGSLARLKDLLKNRIRFSAFDLGHQAKRSFYLRLQQFKPVYFYGYPSLILDFARFLRAENLSLDGVPLKAVIGTGEHVYPDEKEELEALTGVPFVAEYGCSEIGVIGFDCPHGRMHVMAANVFVEVVDADGRRVPDGEEGEIVVTELNAGHFPFLRYRLGDRGRLTGEACSCGRTLPVLQLSAGRKDDYIVTPEGNRVYDAVLAYTLKKGVVQFKAVQDSVDHLLISVVTDSDFDALEQQYRLHLQEVLSSAMRIDFRRIAEIEREPSGKLRYFRSELKKPR